MEATSLLAGPVALQKRLAERDVYFERTFNVTRPPHAVLSMAELAGRIREVGSASTIMATDFGQVDNPPPVEGMEEYVRGLLEHGFGADEVRRMVGDHARTLLEL